MTVRLLPQDPASPNPTAPDTLAADPAGTAYDSVWASTSVPSQRPEGYEAVMLAEDKLPVVLAVVLLIWFGLAFFVLRTDRRIARLERALERGDAASIPDDF